MSEERTSGQATVTVPETPDGFARGLVLGCLLGLGMVSGALYLLNMGGVIAVSVMQLPGVQQSLNWAYRNFGLSLVPFAVVLFAFLAGRQRLQHMLERECKPERVAHADHMLDVWITMFFGIGVLWTAIGMRDALVFALSDPGEAAREGAFAILQRLVDGGILVALSTTILGGVGGYLLRVLKALTLGSALKGYYARTAQAQGAAIHESLLRIEARLDDARSDATDAGYQSHVAASLDSEHQRRG